jgi:hypothetical protein
MCVLFQLCDSLTGKTGFHFLLYISYNLITTRTFKALFTINRKDDLRGGHICPSTYVLVT